MLLFLQSLKLSTIYNKLIPTGYVDADYDRGARTAALDTGFSMIEQLSMSASRTTLLVLILPLKHISSARRVPDVVKLTDDSSDINRSVAELLSRRKFTK